jgi:hypothetical protein
VVPQKVRLDFFPVKVIDADTHLYEGRGLWAEHTGPRERGLALRIADDELGHAWLMLGDRRIHLAEVHHPGDVPSMGVYRERVRAGLPAERPYDEALPRHFWDPVVRRDRLDEMGLDEAVVFPNFGLLWERSLASDLPATRVNMAAWNRWAVAVAQEGRGRLHPVAHLGLRDRAFLEDQLRLMAAGDLRWWTAGPCRIPTSTGPGRPSRSTA